MVVIHLKRSEDQQFLYETSVETPVKAAVAELAAINNLRHRIQRLKLEGGELAKYGPSKHPDKQGLDEYQAEFGYGQVEKGSNYKADPTGRRIGNAPDENVAKVLTKTLDDAMAVQHKDQVAKKVPLTVAMLEEAIDTVRGAVMIAYPMGLPEWDLVRQCLEGTEELAGTSYANDEFDPETAQLWWAGKMMIPENKLSDHVGRNEKTKVIAKLTKKGSGAPQREQAVDAQTQKEMMAFYHRKQEEMKKLAENQDDDYTASTWANPKALKGQFAGVSDVRFR